MNRKVLFLASLFAFILVNAQAQTMKVLLNPHAYKGGYHVSCNGRTDGSIDATIVGGTTPYTYLWNNGRTDQDIDNLAAGNYTLTVTDAQNHTGTKTIQLLQPDAMAVIPMANLYPGGTHISKQGASDGTINTQIKGGTPPYIYGWSNNSTKDNITNVIAGGYDVMVTDMNGCSAQAHKDLVEPPGLIISDLHSPEHLSFHVSCGKGNDGKIFLTVNGGIPPYSYKWSNGAFTQNLDNLVAGIYQVEVTDKNGGKITGLIELHEPPTLTVNLQPNVYSNSYNISCYACSNGSISSSVTSGVPSYSYLWSNGATTQNISNLTAGDYTLTVTDANGCQKLSISHLTQPAKEQWGMNGNANTDPTSQFLGTTDNKDFVFKTNNIERLRLDASGTTTIKKDLKMERLIGNTIGLMYVDNTGNVQAMRPIIPLNPVCDGTQYNYYPFAWETGSDPAGVNVFNCWQRFGLGTLFPQERLEVKGMARFDAWNSENSYVNIGHDGIGSNGQGGNAEIYNAGNGDLLINYDTYNNLNINQQKSVYIATGNSGDVVLGNSNKKVQIDADFKITKLAGDGILTIDPNGLVGRSTMPTGATLWNANGNNIFNSNGGNVGIGTNNPLEQFQIGNLWTFSNGGAKVMAYNFHWDNGDQSIDHSLPSAAISFDDQGTISFKTAPATSNSISWIEGIKISNNGNVGIGTGPSQYKLNVYGTIQSADLTNSHRGIVIAETDGSLQSVIDLPSASSPNLFLNGAFQWVDPNANSPWIIQGNDIYNTSARCIGIGLDQFPSNNTWPSDYKLAVNGKIIAEDFMVKSRTSWPDYVFKKDYELLSLKELESFINVHHHLPGIHSANEIESSAIGIGEMQSKQMEKIEELTLYLIQMKKEIDDLKKENATIKSKLNNK